MLLTNVKAPGPLVYMVLLFNLSDADMAIQPWTASPLFLSNRSNKYFNVGPPSRTLFQHYSNIAQSVKPDTVMKSQLR